LMKREYTFGLEVVWLMNVLPVGGNRGSCLL